MKHLTDEQLAERLDGSRSAEAEQHLAGCAECRERLAGFASLDEDLARALDHDPGEAYFASFADRVAARIATAAGAAPAAAPAPRRGWFAWWNSPRSLAWAGGTLAVIAVAALAVVVARERGTSVVAGRVPPSELGSTAAPQAANELRSDGGASPPAAGAPEAREQDLSALRDADGRAGPASRQQPEAAAEPQARRDVALDARARRDESRAKQPAPRSVAPQRLVQLKTLPNGEQVAVAPVELPTGRAPGGARTPSGFEKPGATPMKQSGIREERAAQNAAPSQGTGLGAISRERTFAAPPPAAAPSPRSLVPPPPTAASAPGSPAPLRTSAAPSTVADKLSISPGHKPATELAEDAVSPARICGTVRDPRGRLLAGVVISVAETGASTRSAADGTFCLESSVARPTLEAFSIGYRAYRGSVSIEAASAPVALTLLPVETLGTDLGLGRPLPAYRGGRALETRADAPLQRAETQAARAATAEANRLRTVTAWQHAADEWSLAATRVAATSPEAVDARFHVAEARIKAWRIGRTAAEHAAADAAVRDYLASAPAGPLRDLAEGWRKELAM